MDHNRFHYAPGPKPNIVFKQAKTDTATYDYKIDATLEKLANRIAMRKPAWTVEYFPTTHSLNNGGKSEPIYPITSFNLWLKQYRLGEATRDVRNYQVGCRIFNARINNDTRRGRGIFTSDTNRAIKIIEKYFGPPSLKERMADALHYTANLAHTHVSTHTAARREAEGAIHDRLCTLAAENWNGLGDKLFGGNAEQVAKFIGIRQTAKEATRFSDTQRQRYGSFVLQVGEEYATYDDVQADPSHTGGFEELPGYVQQGIALLRLVENKTVIPGVGIRTDETTFYILTLKGAA